MVMCPPKERPQPNIRSHLGHSTPLALPSGCEEHVSNGDAFVGLPDELYGVWGSDGVVDVMGLLGDVADCGICLDGEGDR